MKSKLKAFKYNFVLFSLIDKSIFEQKHVLSNTYLQTLYNNE